MKNLISILVIMLTLSSCGKGHNETERNDNEENVVYPVAQEDTAYYSIPPQAPSVDAENPVNENTSNNAERVSNDYQLGYNSGFNMGQIAASNYDEYNPYLPVGPNVRTFSLEYRQGYAAGYAAGYDKVEVQRNNAADYEAVEDYEDYDY